MKGATSLLVAVVMLAGVIAFRAPASLRADGSAAPLFVTTIPPGYRDWRLISVAHEEGNLNSLGAILGNDVAIKAYRDKTLPFPDGTIIAALHYSHVPSAENNKVFGKAQSFVPGAQTNIQFMVKDSTKYAATGGWGFATFVDGKPAPAASMKSCFPCHNEAKTTDLVFTHYAP
jgi:Cytochrome P460